jgi:hypothetical protein
VKPMTEDEIAKEMESLTRIAPRSWKDLLQQFHGQHYRDVYCAFGQLRPRLGRIVKPPYFPYAFSNSGDFIGEISPAAPSRSADPRKTLQTKSYILMPHDGRYGHEDYGVTLTLAFLVVAMGNAMAQSGGRGGKNLNCPNGGYVNGKYYCNMRRAPR